MNTMVIHGQLDDAFILEENRSQHLFFMGMDSMLFTHIHSNTGFFIRDGKDEYFKMNAILIPFYYGNYSYDNKDYFYFKGHPIMILPVLSVKYITKWYIASKIKINFNAFISSPNISGISFLKLLQNIYGPGASIGVGLKINIKKSDIYPLSYKLNIGIDYTGDLTAGISLKNSILIGIKRESSSLSFNPFLNIVIRIGTFGMLFSGMSEIMLLSGAFFSIVLEPGFELTSKVVTKNNFVFISSFMIGYEANLSPSPLIPNMLGKIVVSASFGLGSIAVKK